MTKKLTMSAIPTAWRVCLTLFVCLLGLSATRPLTAAETQTEVAGLLAILQPATDDAPAVLKFYSPDDPLLITTDQGLYRLSDTGGLSLVHSETFIGVSYSHTDPNELWAVGHNKIYKSEDNGATWGEASSNLRANSLHAPLLMAPLSNNPQLVGGHTADAPARVIWRGTGNGFWEPLLGVPPLSLYLTDEQGLAWDVGNRVLYLGGEGGELFAVTNVDAANVEAANAVELRLPLVAAG